MAVDLESLLKTLAASAGLANRLSVTCRQQQTDASQLLNSIERLLAEVEMAKAREQAERR
jgi:hypothetical protein